MNNLPISTYFKSRNFDQVNVILRIYKEFHELTNKNIRDKTNQLIINSHFNILKALRKLLLSENPEECLRNSLNFRELEQIHTKLLAEDTFDKKDTFRCSRKHRKFSRIFQVKSTASVPPNFGKELRSSDHRHLPRFKKR